VHTLRALDDRDQAHDFEAAASESGRWYVGTEQISTMGGAWGPVEPRPYYRCRLATADERTHALPLFRETLPLRLWNVHDCPSPVQKRLAKGVNS
jgi:hypothetical protein